MQSTVEAAENKKDIIRLEKLLDNFYTQLLQQGVSTT